MTFKSRDKVFPNEEYTQGSYLKRREKGERLWLNYGEPSCVGIQQK